MSKSFKLDDIKAAAEKKYENTEIEMPEGDPVLLVNVLQLSEGDRQKLRETPEGDERSQLEQFREMLRIVAGKSGSARLIEAFGENLAYYAQTIEFYNSETEAGEA